MLRIRAIKLKRDTNIWLDLEMFLFWLIGAYFYILNFKMWANVGI